MTTYPIGVTDVTSENQREVRNIVNQMKKFGHAVSYDSTEDYLMKFISARVIHYKTCRCNPANAERKIDGEQVG